MTHELTPKQQKFVEEYLIDLNATQAAIRAGYSEKTACEQGSRLLANVKVSVAVAEARKHLAAQSGITLERVQKEYARLAFVDVRKLFDGAGNLIPIHEMDDDTAAAISGLEVDKKFSKFADESGKPLVESHLHKIKLSDKKGALDSICKLFGWVVEKKEVTGKDGGPIVTQTKEQRDAAVAAALAADS